MERQRETEITSSSMKTEVFLNQWNVFWTKASDAVIPAAYWSLDIYQMVSLTRSIQQIVYV